MRNRRNNGRVQFEHRRVVRIMARDGSWQRPTTIVDVSETGAKLLVEGSLDGLDLTDFFLALAPTGKAYRRCQMIWHRGDQLGVNFIRRPAAAIEPGKGDAPPASAGATRSK